MNELFALLMAAAVSLSGLPPLEKLPKVTQISSKDLQILACGNEDRCRGLAAVYDTETKNIYLNNSLNLLNDTDNSFLVHEYVHALQHQKYGDNMWNTCEDSKQIEEQAYAVQNKYLKSRGQLFKAGAALRWFNCS